MRGHLARPHRSPLRVFAPRGFHDWEYLLPGTNRPGRDHAIARTSHSIGTFVIVPARVTNVRLPRTQDPVTEVLISVIMSAKASC
jgi:hypothetical protein